MDIYIASIHELRDLAGADLITSPRRDRMSRFAHWEDQARCLAAGLLLRRILGDACTRIETEEHGKPYVPGGPYFNVSHGGQYTAVAVSNYGDIGIDVEEISPYSHEVAERCFQAEELEWLESRTNKEQAFCCLWTGKESVMKSTGLGMHMAPESFSIFPLSRSWRILGSSSWFLTWKRLDNHMICISAMRPESAQITRLSRDDLLS